MVGLSQKRLAAKLGVDPSTVLHWEQGRSQSDKKRAAKIEDLLAVREPRWLTGAVSPQRISGSKFSTTQMSVSRSVTWQTSHERLRAITLLPQSAGRRT